MPSQPAEFELSISRVIDAPRSRVFRAWTEPAMGFHDGWGQRLDRLVTLVTEGMRDQGGWRRSTCGRGLAPDSGVSVPDVLTDPLPSGASPLPQ